MIEQQNLLTDINVYKDVIQFLYHFKDDENQNNRTEALVWLTSNLDRFFYFPVYLSCDNSVSLESPDSKEKVISPHINILDVEDAHGVLQKTYIIQAIASAPTPQMLAESEQSNTIYHKVNLEIVLLKFFEVVKQQYGNTVVIINFPLDLLDQSFPEMTNESFITLSDYDIELLKKTMLMAASVQSHAITENLWEAVLNPRSIKNNLYSFGLENIQIKKIYCWGLSTQCYVILDCPMPLMITYQEKLEKLLLPIFINSQISLKILNLSDIGSSEVSQDALKLRLSLIYQKTWSHFFLFRWWRNRYPIPLITIKPE